MSRDRHNTPFNPARRNAVTSAHLTAINEACKIAAAELAENPDGIMDVSELHPSLRPLQKNHAHFSCQRCNQLTDLELLPYVHLGHTAHICVTCIQSLWEQNKSSP